MGTVSDAYLLKDETKSSNLIIDIVALESDRLADGLIVLSSYGNNVFYINKDGMIHKTLLLEGPINTFNPIGKNGGIGIVDRRPVVYGDNGDVVYDGTKLLRNLERTLPKGAVRVFFHHDVIKTRWGTMMALIAHTKAKESVRDTSVDDVIIEFDLNHNILSSLSLNKLLFNDKWGARKMGPPERLENWLHTNSIDTRSDGHVIVSTRNVNEIQVIDWKKLKKIRSIGKGQLSLQHHAKFQKDGTILVYDNGVKKASKVSGIARYDFSGNLIEYFDLPFYAVAYGSVQKLNNGNWLTINGIKGEIYEFSPDFSDKLLHLKYKSKTWIRWENKYKSPLYRAIKVEN
jgi:hypothetical protein